jgi:hypothetical protein
LEKIIIWIVATIEPSRDQSGSMSGKGKRGGQSHLEVGSLIIVTVGIFLKMNGLERGSMKGISLPVTCLGNG